MAGDAARKKKNDREIQLEYNYDRLMDMKVIQAYQVLVPDKMWVKDSAKQPSVINEESPGNATSRDICKGIF